MKDTVTISIKEYDELRDFRKAIQKNNFINLEYRYNSVITTVLEQKEMVKKFNLEIKTINERHNKTQKDLIFLIKREKIFKLMLFYGVVIVMIAVLLYQQCN